MHSEPHLARRCCTAIRCIRIGRPVPSSSVRVRMPAIPAASRAGVSATIPVAGYTAVAAVLGVARALLRAVACAAALGALRGEAALHVGQDLGCKGVGDGAGQRWRTHAVAAAGVGRAHAAQVQAMVTSMQ